jgi:hypothetical protein
MNCLLSSATSPQLLSPWLASSSVDQNMRVPVAKGSSNDEWWLMALNKPMTEAMHRLAELVAIEKNAEQLRILVLEINALLNVIEAQYTRLQGGAPWTP